MRTRIFLLFILFVLFSQTGFSQLHPFYMQNGDCYVLVGNGKYSGVYALNNLSAAATEKLYNLQNPYDEAYGIVATQFILGKAIQKYIYTFAGKDTGYEKVSGMVQRKVLAASSFGIYAWDVVPPYVVHRFHGNPNNSPTGIGNHPQGTLNYKFSGFDYPCKQMPAPVAGKPGYYWVEVGKFYHAMDWPVWSPYTYRCGNPLSLSRRPNGTYTQACSTRMAGPDPQTREWAKCGCGARSARGGWVHWVLRENVEAKFRDLKLYEYNRTIKSGPVVNTSLPRVKTIERATMDKRGECIDGCITQADGIDIPGGETPFLDTAYSSVLKRSYLYSREPSSDQYTLTGITTKDKIIGNPKDLTANTVGVSSKDGLGNFVYVLGINQINQWLKDAKAPPAMFLSQLTDLAVSDQWWQGGGIVYAYDKTRGKVTKFVRNESSATPASPEEISITDGGSLPDAISCDGFGHLYMIKTFFDPKDPDKDFEDPKTASSYILLVATPDPKGNIYRAYFLQDVSKSVFRRDYYSGAIGKISGEISLGQNTYFRDFKSPTPVNRATWAWAGKLNQLAPKVQTEYRTEVSVINTATPPEVTSEDAVTDCRGPLVLDGTSGLLVEAKSDGGLYRDDTLYFFEVENAPIFDINGVNYGSTGEDLDKDGRTGKFPSTTKESTLKYFWKVLQTKDRYGEPLTNVILDQEKAGDYTTSSLLSVILGGGEYLIGVKSTFQYYDYDKLQPGDLADKKETVLSGVKTGAGEDSEQYSWITFLVKTVPGINCPDGRGVIMSGKPTKTGYSYRPISFNLIDSKTDFCSTKLKNPPGPTFVIQEDVSDWSFQLRESDYNVALKNNRIDIISADPPPDPKDDRMEPGSLKWLENAPQYTWSTILTRGTEGLIDRSITNSKNTINTGEIDYLFPVPSQPSTYTMTVKGIRSYEYWTQKPRVVIKYGKIETEWRRTQMIVPIRIEADCEVYMTDETPPALSHTNPFAKVGDPADSPAFFISGDLMYGTTGESLSATVSPPTANPTQVEMIVADNNPFGNIAGKNFTDQFHLVKTNHDIARRTTVFNYTTAQQGNIPLSTDAAMRTKYSTDLGGNVQSFDLDEKAFKAISWLSAKQKASYNKSFSYRRYYIPVSELTHFSRDKTIKANDGYLDKMDLYYANCSPGYKNLRFGFEWGESCGLATEPYLLGYLVIRDNDRPNVFVQLQEMKNEDQVYFAPSNVKSIFFLKDKWTYFSIDGGANGLTNGVQDWNTGSIAGFSTVKHTVSGSGAVPNTFAAETAALPGVQLETDVPAFFSRIVSDNIGTPVVTAFALEYADGTTDSTLPTISVADEGVRHIFRKPGDFRLVLKIKDEALGWPSEPDARENPTNAGKLPNLRNLDVRFSVLSTRLDVRIMERSIQGR